MTVELSVIICSHNPRMEYLTRVLTALADQTLPNDRWELLLVDNRSDEPLAAKVDLQWQPNARHVREERLGLTPARLAGIHAAQSGMLVFVDDDNILESDYLESALAIANKWPILGAWGGEIKPQFECEPPDWTRKYWPLLAIRQLDGDRWSNLKDHMETTPCGAGMCVRREVATHYAAMVDADFMRLSLDRIGSDLSSCGDTDLALVAYDMGLGTGLFKSLQITHIIPAGRLEEAYLLRLVRGIAYSGLLLRGLRGMKLNWAPPGRSHRLLNFYISLRLNARERRFNHAVDAGKKAALHEISLFTRNP